MGEDLQAGEVVREFPRDVRIVRVDTGEDETYRFESSSYDPVEFPDERSATLYAYVFFDVGGYGEDGSRYVPAPVARSGVDTVCTYLLSQPDYTAPKVAGTLDVDVHTLEEYQKRVRNRAEDTIEELRATGKSE